MSKAAQLESAIANAAKQGDYLPKDLPTWIYSLDIQPGDLIVNSSRIGTKSQANKTDVLIKLKNSPPIKISAKLSNADYCGNWYGHKRFINEFVDDAFKKMTAKVTEWANQWAYKPNVSLFVGVSISFGYRTGNTFIPFLDVFSSTEELIKIVAGMGEGDSVANCLYISDKHPLTITELLENLSPINSQSIAEQSKQVRIICRPINPMTERSNRGKNVYTRFQPYKPFTSLTTVTTLQDLMDLGEFKPVEPDRLNHNRILTELEKNYNIFILRKQK